MAVSPWDLNLPVPLLHCPSLRGAHSNLALADGGYPGMGYGYGGRGYGGYGGYRGGGMYGSGRGGIYGGGLGYSTEDYFGSVASETTMTPMSDYERAYAW